MTLACLRGLLGWLKASESISGQAYVPTSVTGLYLQNVHVIWYNMVWCRIIECNIIWYYMIWYDPLRCNIYIYVSICIYIYMYILISETRSYWSHWLTLCTSKLFWLQVQSERFDHLILYVWIKRFGGFTSFIYRCCIFFWKHVHSWNGFLPSDFHISTAQWRCPPNPKPVQACMGWYELVQWAWLAWGIPTSTKKHL